MWINTLIVSVIIALATLGFLATGSAASIWPWTWILGSSLLVLGICLLIFAPLGGVFGLLTARKLSQRLHNLAQATIAFSNGDNQRRVSVQRKDEVGVLEEQFNRMAQHLTASQHREQNLIAQNVRLDERARISREIHDAISQNLFSLSLLVGGMQASHPEDTPLQARLALFGRTTETMTREMRALLLELRPAQLEDLGLKEALEELATAYTTRLDMTITTEITGFPLPDRIEQMLFRITQEALSNAIRHAQATQITIKLTQAPDTITLVISDNGQGFDLHARSPGNGLGLRLIRERVQEFRGEINIQSLPAIGTSITIAIPRKD